MVQMFLAVYRIDETDKRRHKCGMLHPQNSTEARVLASNLESLGYSVELMCRIYAAGQSLTMPIYELEHVGKDLEKARKQIAKWNEA